MKHFILVLFSIGIVNTISSQCNDANDYLALRQLFLDTNGDKWNTNTNWPSEQDFINNPTIPSGTDMSTWFGIHCNNGEVQRIQLITNKLVGSIPSMINLAVNLEVLELVDNPNLIGSIPSTIGDLTLLTELVLNENNLQNMIPSSIGNLSQLTNLTLRVNKLTGCWPSSLIGFCSQLTTHSFDQRLSGGHDPQFISDQGWADFCADNTGVCGSANCRNLDDYTALRALYLNTDGDSWQDTMGWPDATTFTNNINPPLGTDLSTWTGVSCNFGRVSELDLIAQDLNGNIPIEIGLLSMLTSLNFRVNQLSGEIPTEIADLTNLTSLNLSLNQLSGCWPSSFSVLCSQLTTASFDQDPGIGFDQIISNQGWTDYCADNTVGACCVSDCCDHPDDYTALRALYLGNGGEYWFQNAGWYGSYTFSNNSTPPLGIDMSSWFGITCTMDRVTGLDLTGIGIYDSIPTELEFLTNLDSLILQGNALTGPIPPELGNLSNLTSLNISFNQLTGSIPSELGNLTDLIQLGLSRNQLTGDIPSELGELSKLQILSLGANQLTGMIPPEIGNMTMLGLINLFNNQLTGEIPAELGGLTSLTFLNLGSNKLTGCWPSSFSTLCSNLTFSSFDQLLFGGHDPEFISDQGWTDYCANMTGICVCGITTWTGNIDTDWHTDGNWDTMMVPTDCDDVILPTMKTIDVSTNAVIKSLSVSNNTQIILQSGVVFEVLEGN